MPRPRTSFWVISASSVIQPGASGSYVLDLIDTFYPQVMVQTTYTATAAAAGLTGVIYPGFITNPNGNEQYGSNGTESIAWCANGDTITEFALVPPTLNSGTPQTINIGFDLNAEDYPRFIKIVLVNTDQTNPVTILIVGDR